MEVAHYSFTLAKPKHIFSKIVRIWWFYIFIALILMLGFCLNLDRQIERYSKKTQIMLGRQAFYQEQIDKIGKDYARLNYELNVSKNTQVDNEIIRNVIDNLLELIPDQITINLVEIQQDSLVIRGMTPSKEVFRYLLQDPLRAIFGESHVSFYRLSNGGYKFVSRSKTSKFLTQPIGNQ